jgi:hypothetical protein
MAISQINAGTSLMPNPALNADVLWAALRARPQPAG